MPTRFPRHRSALTALYCAMLLSAGPASADLISPEAARAQQRYEKNPKAFDQADQYCVKKTPDAACTIPGSAFEGGGIGRCERTISKDSKYISLDCTRSEHITIDRNIPDGPFRVDSDLCANPNREERDTNPSHICTEPPVVSDRFCAGAQAGHACVVELTRNGKKESHTGVCQQGTEPQRFYLWGHRQANRPILTCEPVNKIPKRVYTPVSQWKKLRQW